MTGPAQGSLDAPNEAVRAEPLRRSRPLVSVITIFLDEERFLRDAVESVLAQTYTDWELLLCDDGSSDGSGAIARSYAERHPERIRVLEHPAHANLGMSATRNLGVRHSRGELIALLDADDVWLPQKLERQVRALEDHPGASMAFGPSLYWFGWTGRAEDASRDFRSRLAAVPGRTWKGTTVLGRILRDPERLPCTGTFMIRQSAVLAVGGFEDGFRDLFEDWVFLSKVLVSHDVVLTDECLSLYRQHPESWVAATSRREGAVRARRGEYLDWLHGYLQEHPVGRTLRWTVALELWMQQLPALERARDFGRRLWGGVVAALFVTGRLLLPARVRRRLWLTFVERSRTARRDP